MTRSENELDDPENIGKLSRVSFLARNPGCALKELKWTSSIQVPKGH
jgi:hypothetical protein